MKDFVDDNNPTAIFHAVKKLGAPDYVKSAHVIQPAELATVHEVGFADRTNRQFPVHTKAACWLSAAYYFGNQGDDPRIVETIKQAAAAHGIAEDVDALETEFAQIKQAAAEPISRHALTVDFGGAHGLDTQSFYPLNTRDDVYESASIIDRDLVDGRLPIDLAKAASRELVKAAREFGVPQDDISPRVYALGDDRLPDFDNLRFELGLRKRAGLNTEDYEMIVDGAEAEFKQGEYDDMLTCMDKWASLWLDLDASNDVRYGDQFMDPYTALYSGAKVAAVDALAQQSVFINDVLVPGAEVALLRENQIKAAFTPEAAQTILEMQDAYTKAPSSAGAEMTQKAASLAKEDQAELLNMLLNHGH